MHAPIIFACGACNDVRALAGQGEFTYLRARLDKSVSCDESNTLTAREFRKLLSLTAAPRDVAVRLRAFLMKN